MHLYHFRTILSPNFSRNCIQSLLCSLCKGMNLCRLKIQRNIGTTNRLFYRLFNLCFQLNFQRFPAIFRELVFHCIKKRLIGCTHGIKTSLHVSAEFFYAPYICLKCSQFGARCTRRHIILKFVAQHGG